MISDAIINMIEDPEHFDAWVLPELEFLASRKQIFSNRIGQYVPVVIDIPFLPGDDRHIYIAEEAVQRKINELEDLISDLVEMAEIDGFSKDEVLGVMTEDHARKYTNVFERESNDD